MSQSGTKTEENILAFCLMKNAADLRAVMETMQRPTSVMSAKSGYAENILKPIAGKEFVKIVIVRMNQEKKIIKESELK